MKFLYIALTVVIGFLTEERNSINFKFLNSKQISIVSKSKDLIPKEDKKKKLNFSLARNTSSTEEKKPEESFV